MSKFNKLFKTIMEDINDFIGQINTNLKISPPEIYITQPKANYLSIQYVETGNFLHILNSLLQHIDNNTLLNLFLEVNCHNYLPGELILQLSTIPAACKFFFLRPLKQNDYSRNYYEYDDKEQRIQSLLSIYGDKIINYNDYINFFLQNYLTDEEFTSSIDISFANDKEILNSFTKENLLALSNKLIELDFEN